MLIVFYNYTATSEFYTYYHHLSLHDALPICLNWTRVEKGTQDARVPHDLALLAPDQMPDACHHDLARVDVIGIGVMQLQLAPRRSAQSCADVQAVSAVGRRRDRKSTRLNSSH